MLWLCMVLVSSSVLYYAGLSGQAMSSYVSCKELAESQGSAHEDLKAGQGWVPQAFCCAARASQQ